MVLTARGLPRANTRSASLSLAKRVEQFTDALGILDTRRLLHARRHIDPEWPHRAYRLRHVGRGDAAGQENPARCRESGGGPPIGLDAGATATDPIVRIDEQQHPPGPSGRGVLVDASE